MTEASVQADMDVLVGYILLSGVLVSTALVVAGLSWGWIVSGHLGFDYSIAGMTLFDFVLTDLRQMTAGATAWHGGSRP